VLAAFCKVDLTRRYEELCAHYGMTPSGFCSSPPRGEARVISPPPSGSHTSRTGGACCSPAPADLVQRLQVARRELALERGLAKLDKYSLLILWQHRLIPR